MTDIEQAASESAPRRHALVTVLFAVYLVLLAWIILWKLEIPYVGAAAGLPRPLKLVPYVASGDAGASAPLEVVANVILFIPFGIYLGMLAPTWRGWQLSAVFLGASLLLETSQHVLSTGSFDTTDVIDNTLGGMVGVGVLMVARRWLSARSGARAEALAGALVTRVCLIAAIVLVVAVVAFKASGLHYENQRDVVVPRPGVTVTR